MVNLICRVRIISCSVDLLIVKALEIAAKLRLRRLVFHFDSWKLPQYAPSLIAPHKMNPISHSYWLTTDKVLSRGGQTTSLGLLAVLGGGGCNPRLVLVVGRVA